MTMAAVVLEPVVSYAHATVMRAELVQLLAPRAGGLYLDCTAGGGGHTEEILESNGLAQVIASDCDSAALTACGVRLAQYGDRLTLWQARFDQLAQRLEAVGIRHVDGLVADLGVSSHQLDDPSRGLSFRLEGPLDMRMNPEAGPTALELIAQSQVDDLADLIYHFGDERRSRRIAKCIKQAQVARELRTTLDLRRAVVRAVGPRRVGGIDPATRTFQALRIAVNGELEQVAGLLQTASRLVAPGGTAVFISFHSLEDRLVKRAFADAVIWERKTRKPLVPSAAEQSLNPRSRSAKLRAATRVVRAVDPSGEE
ncbi:16S rRNA (cytosine(1402)-N(4))-methyltransferase RsmH [Myxococcota bacterium]